MYAGRGQTVPLPKTGHLHVLKTGYVYWENDGRWDKEKKQPEDTRVSIGKIDPTDKQRMFPNRKYYELFSEDTPPGDFGDSLSYGPYFVLRAAAEAVGCMPVLEATFGKDEAAKILALAIHAICAGNSTAQDFEFWAFHNYCGLERNLDSKDISWIYERVAAEPERISAFMAEFRSEYDKRINVGHRSMRCVAFDSTNQNTTSDHIMMAEYGHAKKDRGIPQINTALFVDEDTGIPLYYEHFHGSILDKSQTPYTIEKAQELGFQKLFVMMDRGYFAQQTATAMSDLEFGLMAPKNTEIVSQMIDEYAAKIRDQEQYYIESEDVYGIHVPDQEVLGGRYDAYLFFDPVRAQKEREQIHAKVRFLVGKAEERKRFTDKLRAQYQPWLDITKSDYDCTTRRNFVVKRNTDKIQAEILDAGLFVVVSNAGLTATNMIEVARMRDWGEKAFQRMKSHLGVDSPGTHTLQTYEGKMFVTFVALIVVEAYRWFARDVLRNHTSTTVATSLGELSKYMIRNKSDGSWMPAYAATRKQKKLLQALDRTESELVSSVRNLRLIV